MRKKSALHLDARYNTMIENAFYYCNPPEYKREEAKQRPPQHEYIRRLLYRDLNKVTTERVRTSTYWHEYIRRLLYRDFNKVTTERVRTCTYWHEYVIPATAVP